MLRHLCTGLRCRARKRREDEEAARQQALKDKEARLRAMEQQRREEAAAQAAAAPKQVADVSEGGTKARGAPHPQPLSSGGVGTQRGVTRGRSRSPYGVVPPPYPRRGQPLTGGGGRSRSPPRGMGGYGSGRRAAGGGISPSPSPRGGGGYYSARRRSLSRSRSPIYSRSPSPVGFHTSLPPRARQYRSSKFVGGRRSLSRRWVRRRWHAHARETCVVLVLASLHGVPSCTRVLRCLSRRGVSAYVCAAV